MTVSRVSRFPAVFAALALALLLAGCDNAEERAERHYQSALALIEEGDPERAIVELRNVFDLQPWHREARETLARLLYERGELGEAVSQYGRLVEQYPENLDAQLFLAEQFMRLTDFGRAEPHVEAAQDLAPEDPRTRIVVNALAYRDAILAESVSQRSEVVEVARGLREERPDSVMNLALIADAAMMDEDYTEALVTLERLIDLAPENRTFWQMRLNAEARLQDHRSVEATLLEMIERFPEDETLPQSLIRFFAGRGDLEGAEAFLRDRIPEGERDDGSRVTLVRFLNQAYGIDRALDAVDGMIEEGTNDDLFRSMRASLLYDSGRTEDGLGLFEEIIAAAEPSAQTNDIMAAYARLLVQAGDAVGARALVEDVLEADAGHVEALQMQARWQIAADETDEAILSLRRAQDGAPDNPQVFTLLAEAYMRNGERDLAGEMLSLAVETSGQAPEQTLRYARFLRADGRYLPTEALLVDALRLTPQNPRLLSELGLVYVAMEDWRRAEAVETELREIGGASVERAADQLRVLILRGRGEADAAMSYLETLAADEGGDRGAQLAVIDSRLRAGDVAGARDYLDDLIAEAPNMLLLRFLDGTVTAAEGDLEEAAAIYRALLDEGVGGERVWVELVRVLSLSGDMDAVRAALSDAIAAQPRSGQLLWMQASLLEQDDDFEGAIEIYERLYEADSAQLIVANNLASLLSSVRTDEESLQRAEVIARRLRGTEFPPFQDTYGWIAYRLGNYEEALQYLMPAAEALPEDALVQAHLGLALAAAQRRSEAQDVLTRALDIAGDNPRPAFDEARATLQQLQNGDSESPSD